MLVEFGAFAQMVSCCAMHSKSATNLLLRVLAIIILVSGPGPLPLAATSQNATKEERVKQSEFLVTLAKGDVLSVCLADERAESNAELQRAIAKFNDALAEFQKSTGKSVRESRLVIATDGNAVAARCDLPTGEFCEAWLWPNWQEPERVYKHSDVRYVKFLSNRYALLYCKDHALIVDTRDGTTSSVDLTPFAGIRAAEDGHWLAVTRDNRLMVGAFPDPISLTVAKEIKLDQSVSDARFIGDGTIIIANLSNKSVVSLSNTGEVKDTLDKASLSEVDCTPTNVFAKIDGRSSILSVDADGKIKHVDLSWAKSEWSFAVSPSGNFFLTMRKGLVPGAVEMDIRKSPLASPDEKVPKIGENGALGWFIWR